MLGGGGLDLLRGVVVALADRDVEPARTAGGDPPRGWERRVAYPYAVHCPMCQADDTKVVDSASPARARLYGADASVRRATIGSPPSNVSTKCLSRWSSPMARPSPRPSEIVKGVEAATQGTKNAPPCRSTRPPGRLKTGPSRGPDPPVRQHRPARCSRPARGGRRGRLPSPASVYKKFERCRRLPTAKNSNLVKEPVRRYRSRRQVARRRRHGRAGTTAAALQRRRRCGCVLPPPAPGDRQVEPNAPASSNARLSRARPWRDEPSAAGSYPE